MFAHFLPNLIPHFTTTGKFPDLWVDPDNEDKRILNINDISELKKKNVGSLQNPQQTNIARQPAFQASGINGRGCLETINTDADDVLISSNPAFASGKDFVVQYAFKFIAHSVIPASYPYQIEFAGAVAQFIPVINATDSRLVSRIFQGVTKDAISSINPLSVNGEYIATHIYDFSNNSHIFRLNGVQQGTSTTTLTGTPTGVDITYFNLTAFRAMSGLMGASALQFSIPPLPAIKRRERRLANYYNIQI